MKKFKFRRSFNRSYGGDILIGLILALFCFIMILPMVYTVSSSLKPLEEIWTFPPKFLVENPTLKNFSQLFDILSDYRVPFTRYLFNTVFITVCGTGGHVLLASMCAYAFAKHNFYGKKVMFNLVVMALMFNSVVTAIPSFIIMKELNWIDTYWSYIVPAFASALGLYLMKQFMEQMVPDSLLEAARIDGCNEFGIFFRIAMPIVKPATITLIILSVQNMWNTGQSRYIFDEKLKTLNYALSQILAGGIARAGVGAAASVIMMAVPILVFVFAQSRVLETMATSGLKE
jgi:ABC-type glycerol-3-phosphate transport system permease component